MTSLVKSGEEENERVRAKAQQEMKEKLLRAHAESASLENSSGEEELRGALIVMESKCEDMREGRERAEAKLKLKEEQVVIGERECEKM